MNIPDKLSDVQLELLFAAYETNWYAHGQSGKAIPGLVKLGLVEFRKPSGGVQFVDGKKINNYIRPAIRLTEEGRKFVEAAWKKLGR